MKKEGSTASMLWLDIRRGFCSKRFWGMYGAAAATVIGQVISAIIAVCYLSHYCTVTLHSKHFRPNASHLAQICSLGMASAINQVAMMIVQITMNNLLKHYGAQSVYGESIPIACSGKFK